MEFALTDLIDGQYRVVEKHRGGMSVVYVVLDEFSQKRFAIKTIKEELLEDRRGVDRFCEEAKTWMNIGRHQHVVEAIIYRDIEHQPFLWLEYVDGSDMQRLLETEKRLLPSQFLVYALEVCEAMEYVHTAQVRSQRGVIHRDLKPANIMLDRRMGVKITDFGLAKVFGVTKGLTDAGVGLGTYYYMPPEQFLDATSADATSDIYSFGACMYSTLTGQAPVRGENVGAVINSILSKIPREPSEVNPAIAPPLSDLVMRCLEKTREARFPSFEALREALSAAAGPVYAALADHEIHKCRGCAYASLHAYRACPICGGLLDVGLHDDLLAPASAVVAAPGVAPPKAAPPPAIEAPPEDAPAIDRTADAALYAQAIEQREAGRLPQALALLRDVLAQDPSNTAARAALDETALELARRKSKRPSRAYNWTMFRGNITRNGYTPDVVMPPLRRGWQASVGEWIVGSPAVVNGVLYIGASVDKAGARGRVAALRAHDGQIEWSVDLPHEVMGSPSVLEGRTLYVPCQNSLIALDCASGRRLWQFAAAGEVSGGPGVWRGMVFFGSADGRLYAIEPESGRLLWAFASKGEIISSAAHWDGVIYVGSSDHRLYAVRASDGGRIWEFTSAGEILGSVAYANERVYVGSADHRIYCVDAPTGQKLWEFQTESEVHSSPAVWAGTVYAGSRDHHLYALDAETGALKWRFATGDWVNSSPLICGSIAYCGSHDGRLYAVECETGVQLWSYETGAQIESSPAASGASIFVASGDGNVYCFKSL